MHQIIYVVGFTFTPQVQKGRQLHHGHDHQPWESGCLRPDNERSVPEWGATPAPPGRWPHSLCGARVPDGKRDWGHLAAGAFPLHTAVRSSPISSLLSLLSDDNPGATPLSWQNLVQLSARPVPPTQWWTLMRRKNVQEPGHTWCSQSRKPKTCSLWNQSQCVLKSFVPPLE